MNLAEEVLKEILTEEVNIPYVTDAIKKKYEVELNYKADKDEKGSGTRIIQPVALGHSSKGNLVLRAFQPYGDTKTKVPKWKLFRLDRIEEWNPLKKRKFTRPKSYNPDGDKTMSDILIQADFTGSEAYSKGQGKYSGLKRANDERAEQKRKKNPYTDLQKNIGRSFDGNKIDYIKRNVQDWQKSKGHEFFKNDKTNKQSAYEMSQIEDFGDDNTIQTVGPIKKDNIDTKQKQKTKLNYQQPKNNGPIMKNNNEEENENTNEKV